MKTLPPEEEGALLMGELLKDSPRNEMPRWMKVFAVVAFTAMIVATLVSIVSASLSITRVTTPTIELAVVGEPVRERLLCAGDTFSLTVRIHTYRSPSLIEIYESWYSVGEGYNVVLDLEPSYSVVTFPENFTRTLTVKIPEGLAPGFRYEYRRLSRDDGAPMAAIAVPINIKECD